MPDQTYQKRCTKCQRTKPGAEFARASESSDGLHWWCKQCCKTNNQSLYKRRKAAWTPPDPTARKLCPICKLEKTVSEFSIQRQAKDGVCPECRDCRRRRMIHRELARLGPLQQVPSEPTPDAISPQYAAGFFDGEGCVVIQKTVHRTFRRPYYTMRVAIVNTNLDVLTRIQRTFGGAIKRRKREKPNKDCYECTICSWDGHAFLQKVAPFLVIKRQQAQLALEFQQKMRHVGNRWGPTPQEEWDRREAQYQQMKRLNARGR